MSPSNAHGHAVPCPSPRLEELVLVGLAPASADELRPGAHLEGLAVGAADVAILDAAGATVGECLLDGVEAGEADLSRARLRECHLQRVRFPVLRAAHGQWRDVHVTSSRLGSAEASDNRWSSVRLSGCKVTYLNLRGATVEDVLVEDCVIDELDLAGCTARRVLFTRTRIGALDCQHAKLEHVDLRGADLAGGVTGVSGLRGATISPGQLSLLAPLLAREVGLSVAEAADL